MFLESNKNYSASQAWVFKIQQRSTSCSFPLLFLCCLIPSVKVWFQMRAQHPGFMV